MKIRFILILTIYCFTLHAQNADRTILFKSHANSFQEALPLGNGHLGALIFGNPNQDRIVLNEKTLWSGGVQDADNENAHQYLKQIQNYLLEGNNKEAQKLLQKEFICKGPGSGTSKGESVAFGCYQTFGELIINWKDTLAPVKDYNRTLDLEKAVAVTSWKRNNVAYKQESFVSLVDNALIIKLTSSKKGKLNFSTSLFRLKNAQVSASIDGLEMIGQLDNADKPGMKFYAAAKVFVKGGKKTTDNKEVKVENADECVIIWSAATDYNLNDFTKIGPNPVQVVKNRLDIIALKDFFDLKQEHQTAFQKFWNRSSFTLTHQSKQIENLSTPERLKRFSKGLEDAQLPVLYYNFGKYLFISSSQEGTLPANLQGIWAQEYQTPWNGDYHLNINVQMNYWLAEPLGLGDLANPLHEFTKKLMMPGQKTAKAYYNASGWVAHVLSNPWGFTSPGQSARWGSTLTGAAWLCEHIWEHYRFTQDKDFLQKYYPVIKGAAEFLTQILIKDPKTGYLVTAPSNSPENSYLMPNGFKGQTVMGPTMDMQICREIFAYTAKAADILEVDKEFRDSLFQIRNKLAPNLIGKKGDLNEWLDDWEDVEPQHRHVSHLYGLHPYDEITPWKTPQLAQAAIETLKQRGDGGTGWSKAWKINFWARLGDGDHALALLKQLLIPIDPREPLNMKAGGTYPNLFCAHPPFQIDGNFGGTAGIAEMLFQSHGEEEVLRFLPALPKHKNWESGEIKGMRARGAFKVNFKWKKESLAYAEIYSLNGGACKALLPENILIKDSKGKKVIFSVNASGITEFNTTKQENYRIIINK